MPKISQIFRSFRWYHEDDTPEERRLLLKLDLMIPLFGFILYWLKYLDQTNLNNAYVSGLKESANLKGNDLSNLQAIFTTASCVLQLAFAYAATLLPVQFLVPSLDVAWGVFTLAQYKATSYQHLAAFRFFIGACEGPFFVAFHFILGSWYKPREIKRRASIFYLGLCLGTLTSGLIQSAAIRDLHNLNGLEGWQWNFIICGAVTMACGLLGFVILPGTPHRCTSLLLTANEVQLARKRMESIGGDTEDTKISLKVALAFFKDWKIYALILYDLAFWNAGLTSSSGAYLLWLKSLNRYSTSYVNILSITAPAIGLFLVLVISYLADVTGSYMLATVSACGLCGLGNLILTIWNVPENGIWFGMNMIFASTAMSPSIYSWMNDIYRNNAAHRALSLTVTNTLGQALSAVILAFAFQSSQAPHYAAGYGLIFALNVATIIFGFGLWYGLRREKRSRSEPLSDSSSQDSVQVHQSIIVPKA